MVLAGGGAKGAYQVGCCRALRAAGVTRLSAIAGTSVGAIHAVMLAIDKLDEAQDIWMQMRWRDVARIATSRLHRLPLWVLAALNSEFSPFKVSRLSDSVTHPRRWRRLLYPAACAAGACAVVALGAFAPALRAAAGVVAGGLAVAGALAAMHARLRPHFLGSTFVSNAPLGACLARAISERDWERARDGNVPLIGTVSKFEPYTPAAIRWGGWVPQYVRLDQMTRDELIATLVTGSALPGFSDPSDLQTGDGAARLDGAWTDNVPAAPLLFDPDLELDVVFVVCLKHKMWFGRRHNSLWGVASLLVGRAQRRAERAEDQLMEWARLRWEASGGSVDACHGRRLARVIPVVPSRRVGNFFSGTMWFSSSRSRGLVELGERDMARSLERLGLPVNLTAPVSGRQAPDTRPGMLPAEAEQALS